MLGVSLVYFLCIGVVLLHFLMNSIYLEKRKKKKKKRNHKSNLRHLETIVIY
jgi:hypothetical protein